jgi:hypothetical protein
MEIKLKLLTNYTLHCHCNVFVCKIFSFRESYRNKAVPLLFGKCLRKSKNTAGIPFVIHFSSKGKLKES